MALRPCRGPTSCIIHAHRARRLRTTWPESQIAASLFSFFSRSHCDAVDDSRIVREPHCAVGGGSKNMLSDKSRRARLSRVDCRVQRGLGFCLMSLKPGLQDHGGCASIPNAVSKRSGLNPGCASEISGLNERRPTNRLRSSFAKSYPNAGRNRHDPPEASGVNRKSCFRSVLLIAAIVFQRTEISAAPNRRTARLNNVSHGETFYEQDKHQRQLANRAARARSK